MTVYIHLLRWSSINIYTLEDFLFTVNDDIITPRARLDSKTGRRILCGFPPANPRCDGEIARVWLMPAGYIIVSPKGELWNQLGQDPPVTGDNLSVREAGHAPNRIAVFDPGWELSQGVWRMTERAKKQLARSRRFGTPTRPYRRWSEDSSLLGRISLDGYNRFSFLFNLPARAECPQCTRVQTLAAERLQLTPDLPRQDVPYWAPPT